MVDLEKEGPDGFEDPSVFEMAKIYSFDKPDCGKGDGNISLSLSDA